MTLKINGQEKGSFYQQASQDTHDSYGKQNINHEGDLDVLVDCDSSCDCTIESIVSSLAPTPSTTMTSTPTNSPTVDPTPISTTLMPTPTCEITAQLSFNIDEVSTYYGYSNDLVGVKKEGEEELCDWWNKEADWGCTHQGDAMIFKPQNKKWADAIDSEDVIIPHAASGFFTFMVYHFFNPTAEGYYTGKDSRDYMNAGVLSVQINGVSFGSYQKKRTIGVETHLENGMKNPEFDADFNITVSCDNGCHCTLDSSDPSVSFPSSSLPTDAPTRNPTPPPTSPTKFPTQKPTSAPTQSPTDSPTAIPTMKPTSSPTQGPTEEPTLIPTIPPTPLPTQSPTQDPTSITTKSPTPYPTILPTSFPTMPPTTISTTLMPTPTCEITAQLSFNIDEVSTYYGYSNDLVGVKKEGEEELCDWWNKEADWGCTHQGDAMIFKPQNKKWADAIDSEDVIIPHAASGFFTFMVYHFFNPTAEGYYTGKDSRDYMNAGVLSVQINGVSFGSYQKKRTIGVETHLENGMKNPEFDADFNITVSCDNGCHCTLDSSDPSVSILK